MKKRQLIVTLEEFFFNRSIHFLMFFESIVTYWAWINSSYFNFWQGLPKSIVYRKKLQIIFLFIMTFKSFFCHSLIWRIVCDQYFIFLWPMHLHSRGSIISSWRVHGNLLRKSGCNFYTLAWIIGNCRMEKGFFFSNRMRDFFLKVFTPNRNLLDIFAEKSTNWCLWMFYTLNMNVQEM